MSTYRAKVRSVDTGEARAVVLLPPPIDAAVAEADEDGRPRTARGIIGAAMLSAPVWMLIAYMIYRLA